MSDLRLPDPPAFVPADVTHPSATAAAACDECLGSGGWFRYEPALEPSPGLLYLSCLHCQGSGRTAQARG
jgi:hypothetical protein